VGEESGRTLTPRALNRALLARQMLLEPAPLTIPGALERMGGLQAQYAPAMYVGLRTRLASFERDELTELLERRRVVQGTLLRTTIHLVSKRDYWPFALGVRRTRRAWYLRARKDVTAEEIAGLANKLRAALAGGPMRRTEIEKLIGPRRLDGVGLWLDLVRVPPSGTWERRRADLYGLAEEWVGPERATEAEAHDMLVRRYLGGFGPSTRSEIADWAGLPVTTVAAVLNEMALRRFRAEDGAELVDLPWAPLPDAETPAPVRLLPVWDATLLVHARRTGLLPEEFRPRIFSSRTPHSFNTFLVNGVVAGTWRHEDGRIGFDEFVPQPASVRRALRAEADRIMALYA
jgi:Winged helix DNA-binding domain